MSWSLLFPASKPKSGRNSTYPNCADFPSHLFISAPENVAAFRVTGTVTTEDYDNVIPTIEEKLADHEDIGVLTDLTHFEDMTADALKRDLQYGLSRLSEFHRFKRAAVISDKQWIKAATDMTGTLFPQIEARVFSEQEKARAMNWVSNVRRRRTPS